MHWTEVVAIVIIVAALIPVLVLFVYLGIFAWAGVKGWAESRRIDLGREYRCDQGAFVRKEHGWVAETEFHGRPLSFDVRDEHGAPESLFLRRLPSIVAKLDELERIARNRVPEVTSEYALDSVLSPVRPDDEYEFALGFSPRDEESYEMLIYVNFQGDHVVGWLGVD
jgi:hypothetical protein